MLWYVFALGLYGILKLPIEGVKHKALQWILKLAVLAACLALLQLVYRAAFAAALIRNLLGLGSLMAFPGSMFGALICGLVYKRTQSVFATLIGEVLGTSILGGFAAYPVAVFLMGKSAAGLAVYAYVVPFLISTAGGAIISAVLILSLKKANILAGMQEALREEKPAHV